MELDICPKCTYILSTPASQCPRCGVIFAKLDKAEGSRRQSQSQPEAGGVRLWLLQGNPGENSAVIGARAVFLLVLAVYGITLVSTPILVFPQTSWLLHSINLVFHEAGHIVFSPFGHFLQVLGGSLGQLLVPVVVLVAFLWQRDRFGAAVGLWWLGESLLDLAPYINDARAGQLMLLGGVTGSEVAGYHDWEVLLGKLGMLAYDHALAKAAFVIGSALILLAVLWGAWLLWQGWLARSR